MSPLSNTPPLRVAFENGEEFMELFYKGADGRIERFILVVEGSIPNEKNKAEGYWASGTGFGGTRIVHMLVGEQLPRIC